MKTSVKIVIGVCVAFLLCILVLSLFVFTHVICIFHEWEDATCDEAIHCKYCETSVGESLGHEWKNATCLEPKRCTICGKTKGNAIDHSWIEATCEQPQKCSVCGKTSGEAKEHDFQEGKVLLKNIVDGYYVQTPTCIICGYEKGVETVEYTSLISDGKLICTPDELMKRIGNLLRDNGYYYLTETDVYEGVMRGVIGDTYFNAEALILFLGDGTDIADPNATNVDRVLVCCYNEDHLRLFFSCLIQAADPQMENNDAEELIDETFGIYEEYGAGYGANINSILYQIEKVDDYWGFMLTIKGE